jgi:hypothetical protein
MAYVYALPRMKPTGWRFPSYYPGGLGQIDWSQVVCDESGNCVDESTGDIVSYGGTDSSGNPVVITDTSGAPEGHAVANVLMLPYWRHYFRKLSRHSR